MISSTYAKNEEAEEGVQGNLSFASAADAFKIMRVNSSPHGRDSSTFREHAQRVRHISKMRPTPPRLGDVNAAFNPSDAAQRASRREAGDRDGDGDGNGDGDGQRGRCESTMSDMTHVDSDDDDEDAFGLMPKEKADAITGQNPSKEDMARREDKRDLFAVTVLNIEQRLPKKVLDEYRTIFEFLDEDGCVGGDSDGGRWGGWMRCLRVWEGDAHGRERITKQDKLVGVGH